MDTNVSVTLVLTLFSLLRKPRNMMKKLLFEWMHICSTQLLVHTCTLTSPKQQCRMFCIFNCTLNMAWPCRPWWSYLLAISMCVCLTLTAGFLMLSQFWLYARGFPVSITSQGELLIYSAYCECSDLCAIVYQITLPLSRWVFISVSYPL